MKHKATVTETMTYYIEFDVPEGADGYSALEDAAREAWAANPARKPDDYECDIEVADIVVRHA